MKIKGPNSPAAVIDEPTMTDLGPATERLCALMAELPDQDLGRPTPCSEYSVGDLLDHLAGITVAFGGAAVKATGQSSTMGPWGEVAHLDPNWRTQLPQRLRNLATAWGNREAWTGTATVAGQQQPGEVTGVILLGELVVHGWDLARGAGLPFGVDRDELVPLYDLTRQTFGPAADPAARGPAFHPAVAVPADASMLDQTLGMLGRDPAWPPHPIEEAAWPSR
jgi:uncharacterized protein (TIGR03086 family)